MRRCGAIFKISSVGFAVPMSIPRYTMAESTLIISKGNCWTNLTDNCVFPDAVGPIKQIIGCIINDHAKIIYLILRAKTASMLGVRDCKNCCVQYFPWRVIAHSFLEELIYVVHVQQHDTPLCPVYVE